MTSPAQGDTRQSPGSVTTQPASWTPPGLCSCTWALHAQEPSRSVPGRPVRGVVTPRGWTVLRLVRLSCRTASTVQKQTLSPVLFLAGVPLQLPRVAAGKGVQGPWALGDGLTVSRIHGSTDSLVAPGTPLMPQPLATLLGSQCRLPPGTATWQHPSLWLLQTQVPSCCHGACPPCSVPACSR